MARKIGFARSFTQSAIAICALLPLIATAAEFTGKVVGISDGDTIKVMHDGKPEKVRLFDTPKGHRRWFVSRSHRVAEIVDLPSESRACPRCGAMQSERQGMTLLDAPTGLIYEFRCNTCGNDFLVVVPTE